jgi:PPM family protein phosphatase
MMKKQSENFLSNPLPKLQDDALYQQPLSACSSITKKPLNRDAFRCMQNYSLQINGIAVADGIGNTQNVEAAARIAVETVNNSITTLSSADELDMELIFAHCQKNIDETFSETITSTQFGTTLIVALEYQVNNKKYITAGYAGNGSIWHVKGNFIHFDNSQLFPWNAVNYLNPHTIQTNGQEALTRYLSIQSAGNCAIPTTICLSCDNEVGDIIVVCTDGIYSYDQVDCATDAFGDVWQKYGLQMSLFFRQLAFFFKQDEYTNTALNASLNQYLETLKSQNLLDDDATIGVLILPTALNYHKMLRNEQNNYHQ